MSLHNKRVLLLGSTGFLGKNLLDVLSLNNIDVTCVNRDRSSLNKTTPNLRNLSEKFDFIVNATGYYSKSVRMSEIWKLRAGNYLNLRRILKYRDKHGGTLITFGSFFEKCPRGSRIRRTPYFFYKRKGFRLVKRNSIKAINPTFYIYLYDTYGPGDSRRKVLDLIIEKLKSGISIELMSPQQVINWSHIEDISRDVLNLMLNLERYDTKSLNEYQIRSRDEYVLSEFVEKLKLELDGRDIPAALKPVPGRIWNCASDLPSVGTRRNVFEYTLSAIRS